VHEHSKLVVDPILCEGRGICAELLPWLVSLDDWGYPIVSGEEIPPELLAEVRAVVKSCPKLALRLQEERG
jgi:ferredoxin